MIVVAHLGEGGGQIPKYPSQPALVAQGFGKGLRLAKGVKEPPEFSKREERIAQVEAEIDALLDGFLRLRDLPQRTECLLEASHRLPVGRPFDRLGTRLAEVPQSFVPHLTAEGVVAEPFDVLS